MVAVAPSLIDNVQRILVGLKLLVVVATLGTTSAMAQLSSEVAKCGELQTEGAKFQMELCSAHLGCRMVLSIQNTCAKAERFISNLTDAVGEGVKTIFGYRKELNSDKVFEASLSDKQRAVEKDKGWRVLIDPIRNEVRNVKETIKEHSASFIEVGDTSKTGQLEGNGFRYRKLPDTVEIERVVGAYQGWTGIQSDVLDLSKDTREVVQRIMLKDEAGNYTPGLFGKNIYADGTEYSGRRILGKDKLGKDKFLLHGIGTFITADGRQMEGTFVSDGFSEGTIRRRDGTLAAKGKWDYSSGNLSVGELFDATGTNVIKTVDRPGDQAKSDAAAKVAREQSVRDAETKRNADAAVAERQFRDGLNTLNAGQLFAKADELSASGDKSKAREVLRTLLSRFPDHPLAATAAQQISRMTEAAAIATQSGGQTSPQGRSSGPGSTLAIGCNESLDTYINSLPAFRGALLRNVVRTLHTDSAQLLSEAKTGKVVPSVYIPAYQKLISEYRNAESTALENHKKLSTSGPGAAMCDPQDGSQASAWAAARLGIAFTTWALNTVQCFSGQQNPKPIPAFCPY